jgi:hypothetical protein
MGMHIHTDRKTDGGKNARHREEKHIDVQQDSRRKIHTHRAAAQTTPWDSSNIATTDSHHHPKTRLYMLNLSI